MKYKDELYSITLASTALVLYLILFSSAASAATEQSSSPTITKTQITTSGAAENYTVNLTVSNSNGADSKLTTIEVLTTEQEAGTLTKVASNLGGYSNPVWSPGGNEILFSKSDGLYKVSSDGSGKKKLTSGSISQYAWSPDGSKISYIEYVIDETNGSGDQICVMNADGTEKTQLLHVFGEQCYISHTWFPSGSKIFYAKRYDLDSPETLYGTINSDGSNKQELGSIGGTFGNLALSPDASKIAFGSCPVVVQSLDKNSQIYFNLDKYSCIVSQTQSWQPQVWSPDGSKIVYWSSERGGDDICTIKADGTGKTLLTAEASNENSPIFSPDGSKIAFVSDEAENLDIMVMDADGNNIVHLTTDTASDLNPVWNPDGTKIAFWSDRGGDSGIYILNLKASVLAFPGYTNPATDLDQNGLYEDINGNGILDFDDMVAYYDNMDWIEENVPLEFFDYNKNGLIDFDDVVRLYDML